MKKNIEKCSMINMCLMIGNFTLHKKNDKYAFDDGRFYPTQKNTCEKVTTFFQIILF